MLTIYEAIGTPDCVVSNRSAEGFVVFNADIIQKSHLAEELPNPSVNIPKAIGAQMLVGFITGLIYLIALFYSVNDINAVFDATFTNPLAEVYRQATGSNGGSLGLLIVILLPTVCTSIGTYITSGRMLWSLARGMFMIKCQCLDDPC